MQIHLSVTLYPSLLCIKVVQKVSSKDNRMKQLLFGLMRSDGNTLDWKLITSSLTFLIEVVKSLLSALAITVYFSTKTQREFTYKNMQ